MASADNALKERPEEQEKLPPPEEEEEEEQQQQQKEEEEIPHPEETLSNESKPDKSERKEEKSKGWQDGAGKERFERWQASRSTVLERNKYMYNNPVMSDIKFAFPNKQIIPAHKYVLATSSPVFFVMFYGDLSEKGETIDIIDCDPEVFLQFLRFVYYDDANFRDVNSAIQVWYLADKYDVPSLATECVNFIDSSMDPLDAFHIIPHARRFNHQGLEKVCWEVIDNNALQIVTDDSFLEVQHQLLLSFVERSSVPIDEVTLFKGVDRWAARKCEEASMTVDGASKRSVLGEELLKQFRFSLMSPQVFSDVVLPTEILFHTEVIDVFKQFTSVSVPGGIKFSILSRSTNSASIYVYSIGQIYSQAAGDVTPPSIQQVGKRGLLTFTVSKAVTLCGVKIITDMGIGPRFLCIKSLSVFQGGKKIRQIKDKRYITNKGSNYGEINVFLNRPLCLSENTCYTIETKTDTTESGNSFMWSLQHSLLKPRYYNTDLTILNCSGHYTECIPPNVHYKGEIMGLLFKLS